MGIFLFFAPKQRESRYSSEKREGQRDPLFFFTKCKMFREEEERYILCKSNMSKEMEERSRETEKQPTSPKMEEKDEEDEEKDLKYKMMYIYI